MLPYKNILLSLFIIIYIPAYNQIGNVPSKVITAQGEVVYNATGDVNVIKSGTYETEKLEKAIQSLNLQKNNSKSGGGRLVLDAGVFRARSTTNGFNFKGHNLYINGKGIGSTIIHFESLKKADETGIMFSLPDTSSDRLIRGGGISDLTLKTDNAHIINYGITINYAEYMQFRNVSLENFFLSGLCGNFWESNFENIIFRFCGAGQLSSNNEPLWGVLDFDSHAVNGIRDACNNTNFSKLTFSSCFGTHIRNVAFANTNVNINIYGLYDETYPGDGGSADNLPIYFFKGVKNFNVIGGFLTVNPTSVARKSYAVEIAEDVRNGQISFSNFEFLQNHSKNLFKQNQNCRLAGFIHLGRNQSIVLQNSTLNDASGSVGLKLTKRYLIDGEIGSTVIMQNVRFAVKKGVWDIGNIISPNINKIGDITIEYYNDSGKTGEIENYRFTFEKVIDGKSYKNK